MENHFRRQILTSAIVILGSIVVAGLGLYFLSLNLDAEVAKVVLYKTSVATKATALENLASLKNGAAAAQKYEKAMGKILVSQDQLINLPSWLGQLAHSRGVSESFSFQGGQIPPSGSAPGYISFGLSAAGPFGNLMDFFKDVEYRQPQFLLSLDNFDVNRADSGYTIAIGGRVFFR